MTGGPRPSAKRDKEWEEEEEKMRIRSTIRISPGIKGAKLSLTGVEAGGYAELLADECLIHVERVEEEFKQIRDQARWLSDFVRPQRPPNTHYFPHCGPRRYR